MATLISASLDVTKITKARLYDGKYLNITISVNDETTYGNNCGCLLYTSPSPRD